MHIKSSQFKFRTDWWFPEWGASLCYTNSLIWPTRPTGRISVRILLLPAYCGTALAPGASQWCQRWCAPHGLYYLVCGCWLSRCLSPFHQQLKQSTGKFIINSQTAMIRDPPPNAILQAWLDIGGHVEPSNCPRGSVSPSLSLPKEWQLFLATFLPYPGWSYTVLIVHSGSSYLKYSQGPDRHPPWIQHRGILAGPIQTET